MWQVLLRVHVYSVIADPRLCGYAYVRAPFDGLTIGLARDKLGEGPTVVPSS